MSKVTEQVFFSGNVQGVGFRWTTERLAKDLPITGFVRNLADKRVELRATGDAAEISRLIDGLKDYFGNSISSVERTTLSEPEDFSSFSIRR